MVLLTVFVVGGVTAALGGIVDAGDLEMLTATREYACESCSLGQSETCVTGRILCF